MIRPVFRHRQVFSFLYISGKICMASGLRYLLVLFSFGLLPLAAQAQLGQATSPTGSAGTSGSSATSAPMLAPQAPSFGNQGASQPRFGSQGAPQPPGFGNQGGQPGFSPCPPGTTPTATDPRTAGTTPTATDPRTAGTTPTATDPRTAGTTPTATDPRTAGPQPGGSAEAQAAQQRLAQSGQSTTAALPPTERNEFQDFIAQSTGRVLPRYGFDLFMCAPSTFAPVENIPMTLDYVIGPGDEILIRVWGQIDGEHRVAVDRDGNISIPRVGTINVSGVRIQDLQGYVRNAIARNYRNFDLSVGLGQLRSIQIFVVGQARRPGSYTVSSLSTLVSALFASGGPSGIGSMRHIQLKRGTRIVSEFDVYDFLAKGDKSKDERLLPGDVIFIPPEGQLVAISGSVKVPAIYELKDKASLAEIIDLAGGLTATAAGQKVLLERIENRKVRRVDEFSLDQAGLARAVKDGDLISVLAISPKFDNAVTLRGNVAAPLRYPYRDGMRITDLIPEKDALIVADYYIRRNLATRIDVSSEAGLIAEVIRASAEINWDYAVVERLDPVDLSITLLPFDLGKAVLERDPAQNLLLQPGDVVTVFSKGDFGVPQTRRTNLVVLENEFKYPGVYKAEPGETLRQLVVRTGGLSPNAYLFGAVFTRESTRIAQQKSLDQAINRLDVDAQQSLILKSQSGLSSTAADSESLTQQAAAQQAVIARLRQLKATGRIILKQPGDAQLQDIPELVLENGDRLQIPFRPSIVNVFGAVYSDGSFIYKADQRVADYLAQSGGPTRTADKGAVYILRADGSVISKRQSGWIMGSFDSERLMPGDTIVVPEDFDRTTWMKTLKDWTQILYQFGLGAAALKVLSE
jgi:protein involved in polysaccharide export with SLBB domain